MSEHTTVLIHVIATCMLVCILGGAVAGQERKHLPDTHCYTCIPICIENDKEVRRLPTITPT